MSLAPAAENIAKYREHGGRFARHFARSPHNLDGSNIKQTQK
jgi:hypothetical protein